MSPTENPKDILEMAYQLFKGGEYRESRKYEGYDIDVGDGLHSLVRLPSCFMHATRSSYNSARCPSEGYSDAPALSVNFEPKEVKH
jgi:hypothetical protein